MSRYWIILWISLLIGQLLTALINPIFVEEVELPPGNFDENLVKLAEATNELWHSFAGSGYTVDEKTLLSRNENLMTRESLILQLVKLESKLVSRGVELEIVQELEAYLGTMDGSESIPALNAYISGIVDWINICSANQIGCTLERLNLYPGSLSGLPVMAFELSGATRSIGELLLESCNPSWRLEELDMLIPGEDMRSWIRGSYVFTGNKEH